MWVANWASTTRSQIVGRLVGDLAEPGAQRARRPGRSTPRMITGQPIKVWTLSTTRPERLQERQGVDDHEEKEEGRAQPEQSLGRRARGVDDRGTQAVEKDRRRERAVKVGEEVDDVEPALNQVAQVVGGQRHGFGRALLAVGDQVANDGQPPDEREVEQAEIAVDGLDERRSHPVDEPLGRHLDQALDHGLDGDLAAGSFRSGDLESRRPAGARSGFEVAQDSLRRAGRPGRGRAAPRRSLGRASTRCAGRPGDGGRSTRVSEPAAARTGRCCD